VARGVPVPEDIMTDGPRVKAWIEAHS
jgi:hypothetical protein